MKPIYIHYWPHKMAQTVACGLTKLPQGHRATFDVATVSCPKCGEVVRQETKCPGRRLIDTVKVGDRVTILTPQGQERTGRAVMPSTHGGWVLNMGGRHGIPGIADDSNTIKVRKQRTVKGA